MGKKTLWTGIVLGALIGGMISLTNKSTRKYVKEATCESVENFTFYSKNPEIAFKELKTKVTSANELVAESTRNAINAIEQVENTVVAMRKTKQIEK